MFYIVGNTDSYCVFYRNELTFEYLLRFHFSVYHCHFFKYRYCISCLSLELKKDFQGRVHGCAGIYRHFGMQRMTLFYKGNLSWPFCIFISTIL